MLKDKSQYMHIFMLIIFCICTACSPTEPIASNKPLISHHYAGCGVAKIGTGNFVPMKIRVHDQDRTYNLRIPSTYDSNRTYPIIFLWHGAGGTGSSGGLNIERSAGDDAILVSADGLNNFWNPRTNSSDLSFFDTMLETVSNQYCIDSHRIFSYGFSVGGSFSNLLACERGDVLRASAAIASGLLSNACKGKVATWLLHDVNDDAVPITKGMAVRDRAIVENGCSTNTVGDGNGCVRYKGCDATPVVWCESKGFGHNIRGDYAPEQVWRFFQSLH